MRKGFVVALAVTGSLALGPAALAATAEPSGALPGRFTPQHAGHDHGKKPDKPKKDDKKGKKGKKYSKKSFDGHDGHDHGHDHDHWHHHHGDSAHASGGYDSHREHPRGWHWGDNE